MLKNTLLGLSLLIVLLACNDDSSPDEALVQPIVQKVETFDSFGQPSTVFNVGETITFVLTGENLSDDNATLFFGSSQQTDFFVISATGVEWDRFANTLFTLATTSLDFMPFESRVFEEDWDQVLPDGNTLAPGSYMIEATFYETFEERAVAQFEVR